MDNAGAGLTGIRVFEILLTNLVGGAVKIVDVISPSSQAQISGKAKCLDPTRFADLSLDDFKITLGLGRTSGLSLEVTAARSESHKRRQKELSNDSLMFEHTFHRIILHYNDKCRAENPTVKAIVDAAPGNGRGR